MHFCLAEPPARAGNALGVDFLSYLPGEGLSEPPFMRTLQRKRIPRRPPKQSYAVQSLGFFTKKGCVPDCLSTDKESTTSASHGLAG